MSDTMIVTKNIFKIFFAVLLSTFFLFVGQLSGQDLNISIQANSSISQGDPDETVNNIGLGIDGSVGYKIPESPILLGINLSLNSFEKNLKRKSSAPGVNVLELNGQTRNRILSTHLYAQVGPTSGIIRPFLGALTGISYPFIDSHVESNKVKYSTPNLTSSNSVNSTVNVGFFSGIKIKLYDSSTVFPNENSEWYLKLKFKYLVGPEAFHLKQEISESSMTLKRSSSRINFITLGIGITANIN